MTVLVAALPIEVLHLRTKLEVPRYNGKALFVAPLVFDQAKPLGARIRRSSSRFDRAFGGKREYPEATEGLVHDVKAEDANDTLIREQFGLPNDSVVGIYHFLWALGYCDAADGSDFLPQFGEASPIRLLGYIRNLRGDVQVAEAIRCADGFTLDVYDPGEVERWDGRTFHLSLSRPLP